ncbi:MAG: glycosyltransferase family 1 protein [Patescibacteria group bacterium]|nr:glycosyltransferase family 1 protein [Patescibacteria group bacterium]
MKKDKKKRIGIDARFYGPLGKGLGRYTQEVVDNIIRLDQFNNYVIFLREENFDELIIDDKINVKKVLAEVRWYTLKEQFLMPYFIWKEKLDLVHFPHFNVPFFVPTKFVITIHDLILTKFKTIRATTLHPFVYKLKNWAYRFIIKRALKNSRRIITVSNFTKNDIVDQFGINPEKISVIYEGVANLSKGRDSLFVSKLDNSKILSDYNIDNPFLLYVGNAYPHKNLDFLVESFLDLYNQNNNLRLVLVGKEDYFYKKIKDLAQLTFSFHSPSPVIFTGYVPDDKLEVFYQKAIAYIFPSLYEGFGLPPLEAMAKGCPVISSNYGSMPEILGDSAIYFDPKNKVDFLEKVNMMFNDQKLRAEMIARGKKHQQKYNWWECAFKTWQIYLEQFLWK